MSFFNQISQLWSLWENELARLLSWPWGTLRCIGDFINFFPIILSMVWSVSALLRVLGDWRRSFLKNRLQIGRMPSFTVLVPFFGDAHAAQRTVASLHELSPAPDEIVLIDDGSPAGSIPLDTSILPENCRLISLPVNGGKAAALNHALKSIHSEIIVCMDADTTTQSKDWSRMLTRFARSPKLGAVTGKIWPLKTGSLVQLMQAIDYLAVICLVKTAESTWGGLLTVSGAWVAYRRSALVDCKGWNAQTSAEDIDLSWRLQGAGWKVDYDTQWTAYVEMAESWHSLWFQRRRWSSGLGRTIREYILDIFQYESRHVAIAFISLMSTLWIVASLGMVAVSIVSMFTGGIHLESFPGGILEWWMGYIRLYGFVFAFQLIVSILVDRGSWRRYPLLVLFSPLYPLYFWCILATSFVAGFPKGFLRFDKGRWNPTANCD